MSRAARPARPPSATDELPDDLPGENDVVRALFHGHEGEAFEVRVGDTLVYLLPWAARDGGVAAFEQNAETFEAWPTEVTGDEVRELLQEHVPRAVSLTLTPAWLLRSERDGPPVSWHARVRWAERVASRIDTAPAVREAWRNGLQVGVPRGYGRYYPAADAVVCYVGSRYDDPDVVTTVLAVDDVEGDEEIATDHLSTCRECEGLFNPYETEGCSWCGARPNPRPNRRLPPFEP